MMKKKDRGSETGCIVDSCPKAGSLKRKKLPFKREQNVGGYKKTSDGKKAL